MQYGLLAEAETLADETMAIGTRGGVIEALAVYGAHLHDIRWAQGRRSEIAPLFIDAAIQNPTIAPLRTVAIGLCWEVGEFDEARRRYQAEVDAGFAYNFTCQWFNTMEGVADAAVLVEDPVGGAVLYDILLPYAGRFGFAHGTPARPVDLWLGRLATLLGRYDRAERHFASAIEMCERARAPFYISRALLGHAELCLARAEPGDPERARRDAERAREIAREFGLGGIEARADAMLASA
jgi:tetratricopeptide (TPR) repeat protein